MPRLLPFALLIFVSVWLGACSGGATGVPIVEVDIDGRVVQVPGRLDAVPLPENRPYRISAFVELPQEMRGRPLALSIPLFEAQVAARVDGELTVPTHETHAYREVGPLRWTIPAEVTEDGELNVELTVQHSWTKSGWLTTTPKILLAEQADPDAELAEALNIYCSWVALGVLFQVGASCLLVFILDRRRRPYLWFGIQAICAMSYPAFVLGLFAPWIGTWDLPLMEVGLCVALLVSFRFTHSYFVLGTIPGWLDGILGMATITAVVVADPFMATVTVARLVAASIAIAIGYQLFVIGRRYIRHRANRLGVGLLGCGWLALAGGTWGDLYVWVTAVEPLGGARPASCGLALFALFLSLVLSRSHIRSLVEADDLNVALARRIDDVEVERARAAGLYEELRLQIADRSAQLFAALGLIEANHGQTRSVLEAGLEINGRYRVERPIGSGAMGMVYLVSSLSDGTRWAMKIANEVRGSALARLAREAHLASKLRHENIVQIRDIDVSTLGFMYIVLELVEGGNLGEHVREHGPMPFPQARSVLTQVAKGLAALHEVSITHRDLKPDNVLLAEEDGRLIAKITDFGISRSNQSADDIVPPVATPASDIATAAVPRGDPSDLEALQWSASMVASTSVAERDEIFGQVTRSLPKSAAAEGATGGRAESAVPTGGGSSSGSDSAASIDLTGTGFLVGTPHYIAPELVGEGSRTDPQADLFSFGVLAYELLTGKRPFEVAVATRLLRGEDAPERPTVKLPPEADSLAPLIHRCLSFDPEKRPSAHELCSELLGLK